jgi:putative peptidoglycan lipid II flippase
MFKVVLERIRANPILNSSISIGLITVAAKFLGYIEKIVLAYYFGTSYEIDVYNLVITIVFSIFIFFREIIEPGFLNLFMKAMNLRDENGAWNLFNRFFIYIFMMTLALSVFVFFIPAAAIHLFAPGFSPEKKKLAIDMIKIAFPACVFLSLSALTNITLNGLKRFALPASSELAFKATILFSLFFLYRNWGIYSVVLGIVVGAAIKLFIQIFSLFKDYSFSRKSSNADYIKDAAKLTWPLLLGVTFSQANVLVDNLFASYLQEGAISALQYAKKIIDFPIMIFPYILGVVIFPYFSNLSIMKEKDKLNKLLSQSLAWISLVFFPLSIFFYSFPQEIVEIVLKRGAFDTHSIILTARPFASYATGMIFFAIETVLVIFYFANSNTKTPIFIGILCVIENIILTFVFINHFGYVGIALALVISKATKVIILSLLLKNTVTISYKAVFSFLCKITFSTAVVAAVIYASKQTASDVSNLSIIKKAIYLTSVFMLGTAAYILTLFLLKLRRSIIF